MLMYMKRITGVGFIVALGLIVAIVILSAHGTTNSAHATDASSTMSTAANEPAPPSRPSAGYMHAIPVSSSAIIMAKSNGVPAITAADVQPYLQTHSFMGGPTLSGKSPTITITFMTAKQAGAKLVTTFGPSIQMVYYVEFQGPFLMENESLPPGVAVPTAQTGFEVFDAQTGDLIEWGG
jgi:hypothetical protein